MSGEIERGLLCFQQILIKERIFNLVIGSSTVCQKGNIKNIMNCFQK